MSALARIGLFLTVVSLVSLVKTWPQTSPDAELHRQRRQQSGKGSDKSIPRDQPFHSSYNSEQDKNIPREWPIQSSYSSEQSSNIPRDQQYQSSYGTEQNRNVSREWPSQSSDHSNQDSNISRDRQFQSSYSSEQEELLHARREHTTIQRGIWDHFRSNETNIHAQSASTDSLRTVNKDFPMVNKGPRFNSSVQKTVIINSPIQQEPQPFLEISDYVKHNYTSRGDPHITASNVSLSSKTSKQGTPTGAQSSELHAVSRGNRRVASSSASVRPQTLSNTNQGFDKSGESRFQSNFPLVSFDENDQAQHVQNKAQAVGIQNRNQPLFHLTDNKNARENIPNGKDFQNVSNVDKNVSPNLSVQGRIVTPVVMRGTRPNISTQMFSGLSSSSAQFKGDGAQSSGGPIVFPDSKFKPMMGGNKTPACSKGSTFCTDVEDYPLPHLNSILKTDKSFKEYFGIDKADDLTQRIGPVDGDPMCRSQERLIFPKLAQNKNEEWMFIVNLDKEYIQGVRIETCEKDEVSCQLSEAFPPGYVTYCRQKYIYRKLLAVGEDGKPAPDSFKLPSCCACFYRKTSVENRIQGGSNSTLSKP